MSKPERRDLRPRWYRESNPTERSSFDIDFVVGSQPSQSPKCRINQLAAELNQWRERAERAEAECEELRQSEQDWWNTFGIQRSAEMRGIRMWQKETGKKLTLPDTARFVVWLLNKLDAAGLLEEVAEAALTASAGDKR